MHPVQTIVWLGVACCLAIGIQPVQAETLSRSVEGVSNVRFHVPGELSVRHADVEKLTIEAESSVLKNLDVAVKGNMLNLSSKGSFRTDKPLRFVLTLKSLKSLQSDSSGNVAVDDFAGGEMQFMADGSGDLRLTTQKLEQLTITVRGSGNVDASGSGRRIIIRLDGTGNVDASRFRAQAADARIDGAGNIRLHADNTLKAVVNGSGNIEYQGNAKVTQSVTGAGSVDRM